MKELEQLYARTEHWISDFDFYADEFRFLINLTDKYFIGAVMADATISDRIKEAANNLLRLDDRRMQIAASNKEHLQYLAGLLQGKELYDPEECRDRQADLEGEHTDFLKKYRQIKKEVFLLSEQLLGWMKDQKLIGS